MFSLLITILVFTFGAYYAYQHLHGWTAADNDAPPIGRRRLSAEEWAEQPFIKGVTKTCSVTAGGKRCDVDHRHVHCPWLPAAKAERAKRAAMLDGVRPMSTTFECRNSFMRRACALTPLLLFVLVAPLSPLPKLAL
jgi:hypothetical protein